MNNSNNHSIPWQLTWTLASLTALFALVWLMPQPPSTRAEVMPLWLHTAAETFSIVVAMLVFGITWNAWGRERPGNIKILACALLAVGLLDLGHVLSFKGMPDFITPSSAEKGINFWLSARLIGALAMLTIALRTWQPFRSANTRHLLLAGSLLLVAAIYWLALFHPQAWPRTYVEGKGLTPFKIGAEYTIAAISFISALLFYRHVTQQRHHSAAYLFAAALTTVLSELSFTLYSNVTDLFNLLGHIYKILAYVFIYHAVFVISIRDPYLKLQHTREQLGIQKMLLNAQGEASIDGVLSVDNAGQMIWHNRRLLDMWHIPPDLVEAGLFRRLLHHIASQLLDADAFMDRVERLQADSGATDLVEIQLRNGQVFDLHSSPMTGADGAILGRVWRFRDISFRKQAELELIRHRDHLEELVLERTAEAVQARVDAERADQAKSLFLANMSHELRTPMHAILSFSKLGMEKTAGGQDLLLKLHHYFEHIAKSGDRLLLLLNDLLDLSKLESGKMLFHPSPQNLRALIQDTIEEIAILAGKKSIRIDVDGVPAELLVECDAHRIEQVLHNLISNAIKFSPADSTITISALLTDMAGQDTVTVRIEDAGIGIPAEELETVFDKFVQSSKTHSKSGGTGLGLSICREIIEKHGGTIHAENNHGHGATLVFTLPLKQTES